MLQELSEATWQTEEMRRLSGVKHVDHEEAKVFLQPLDVTISAVEDLQDQRVCKRCSKGGTEVATQGESVHDIVMGARGDLHEAREAKERPAPACHLNPSPQERSDVHTLDASLAQVKCGLLQQLRIAEVAMPIQTCSTAAADGRDARTRAES